MILLPRPKSVEYLTSNLKLSNLINITYKCDQEMARLGVNKLFNSFKQFKLSHHGTNIVLCFDQNLKEQEYILNITPTEVEIIFSTSLGCLYGVVTLKQIIVQSSENILACLTIKDSPDFKDRGLMLDISRNRVYKVETIKHIIDMLSDLKLNQLQFNVEGNSYYYPSKDKYYSSKDDYLTKDDILIIDKYAKENGIRLIPNQNSFGHMCFWLNQKEFNHLAECPNGFTYKWMVNSPSTTLNPLLDESYKFVTSLYDEMIEGFSENTFNIGGDEPFELGFDKSKEVVTKKGKDQVYLEFILKLYNYLKTKGYRLMMWGDVIKTSEHLINQIPKDIIALEWGYDENAFSDEELQKYVKGGYDYYVCPGTSMWNSIAGILQNSSKNIKRAAILGKRNNALGFLNTDWGDGGSWQQLSLSYIPYFHGCVYSWNANEEQDNDVIQYLNQFIYQDETNQFSQFIEDLSKYSLIEKTKDSNATNLFKMLYIQQTDHINFGINYSDPMFIIKDPRRLSLEEYQTYVHFFERKLKEFSNFNLKTIDKKIINDEVLFALKILLVGAKLGVYLQDLYSHTLEDYQKMVELLKESIIHYQNAWKARNKLSDLKLSLQRMNDLYYKLSAILERRSDCFEIRK